MKKSTSIILFITILLLLIIIGVILFGLMICPGKTEGYIPMPLEVPSEEIRILCNFIDFF